MSKASRPRLTVQLVSHELMDEYMRYRGISNVKLAEKVGVDTSTIAHLRRGARKNCDIAVAPKIAETLGVPQRVLFVEKVIDDWSGANRNGPAINRLSA